MAIDGRGGFCPVSGLRGRHPARLLWATKRRKSRKIRDSEADISRPGNKNCGCAHEVAGDDQQERMPAVAYRYTFGVASAF